MSLGKSAAHGWTSGSTDRALAAGILVAALYGCDNSQQATARNVPAAGTLADGAASVAIGSGTAPATAAEPAALAAEPAEVPTARILPETVTFADAEAAFRGKRYGEAVELFAAYVEHKPNNGWGHYMLGLSAWKAGEHEKAERAFEQALRLDPRHVKSLLNWSRVLLETQRAAEALAKIETAVAIDPESKDGYRLLGRAHSELGQVDAAIEAYRQAIARDERDAWSMNNLGLVYITAERFSEALPPLARATELRSDIPTFHNNLGIALERTGHFQVAAASYRAALAQDPGYARASVSLARLGTLEGKASAGALDLSVLAQQFSDEVQGWRQPVLSRASPAVAAEDSSLATRPVRLPDPQPENPEEQD